MEIIVYEMKYEKEALDFNVGVSCVPFEPMYFEEYMQVYNECFYPMRKALEIEPYNFLNRYDQIENKIKDMYLLMEHDKMYKFHYLKYQSIFFLIGLIIMYIISKINYKVYYQKSNLIIITCLILLILVLIPGIGSVRNGSRSWFGIGS